MTSTTPTIIEPWYRQGWPWFLISIPLTSIVLGGVMLFLSMHTNNSLVVDDYYQEGKTINQRIERDRQAAVLGLSARIESAPDALLVQLHARPTASAGSPGTAAFEAPDRLQLRWVHVMQAERDGAAVLTAVGGGRYAAPGVELPHEGHWRIHLQPAARADWRLVSDRVDLALEPSPALAAKPQADSDPAVEGVR